MSLTFADITAGIRLAGVVPNAAVTVAALQVHGPESATLTCRTAEGNVAQRLISASCCTRPCTAIMCARPAPGAGGEDRRGVWGADRGSALSWRGHDGIASAGRATGR